ncbi:MAG: ABC transporter permease [Bifidobacteriaceae bacterium]|jgi:oligopeptide transport system permease protein|nr:ABC transporter permease [Bifidobacteriaceae bacterium]
MSDSSTAVATPADAATRPGGIVGIVGLPAEPGGIVTTPGLPAEPEPEPAPATTGGRVGRRRGRRGGGTGSRSTLGEAWHRLRRQWTFWFSAAVVAFLSLVAAWPGLFTARDPHHCLLRDSRAPMSAEFPLGADFQGCDILTTIVHGARASLTVGLLAALGTTLLGTLVGVLAGYFGGIVDAIVSRITDIFFAIPLILGAVVAMQVVEKRNVLTLTAILMLFGWTGTARIARSATIEATTKDYVAAARTLGAGHGRIILTHVLPNILAPLIVVVTMAIGGLIAAEASLSYLSIGLPPDVPSWGKAIADGQTVLKANPGILLWPAGALTLTVFAFLTLGDAVRGAFGPKAAVR